MTAGNHHDLFQPCSALSDVVLKWAFYAKETPNDIKKREKSLPIIKIYLSKFAGMKDLDNLIDLTNKDVRDYFVSGATQISRVKSSQEVLFLWGISKINTSREIVFELWEIPPMPKKHLKTAKKGENV